MLFKMHERNPDKRPKMADVVEELKAIKELTEKIPFKARPISPTASIVDPRQSMSEFCTESKMSRHKNSFKYAKMMSPKGKQ